MSRLPAVSPGLMIKFLNELGFKKSRQHGSHIFFRHPDGRTTTIPFHKGEDLSQGLTNKILHDIDISRDEFLTWLARQRKS
jgi:predicted RNA binding protein YcfA (HicA-like mRNA interferase family)